jgi:hypothetical protein
VTDDPGVELQHVQPRLFGWIPPLWLLGGGGTLFLAAVALLATAHWVLAPILLVLALALLGLYVVAASHLPQSETARRAVGGVWRARDGVRFAGSSARAWTGAGRQVLVLQRELRRMGRERDAVQHELGAAVYRGDEAATEELRGRMQELDARMSACAEKILAARTEAEERVSRARLTLSSTEILKRTRKV